MTRFAKFLILLALFPVLMIALATGYLYLNQDRMIFPAPSGEGPSAADGNPNDGLDIVSVPTSDGEVLVALFHPPQDDEASVLLFHGNGDSISRTRSNGVAFVKAGFGVLMEEYRGYPGSTGSPSEAGLLLDGLAGYDFLAARSSSSIVAYAHSLGTGVAIHLAGQRPVEALSLIAPFDSVLAVAQSRYPFLPIRPLLRHPFQSDKRIAAVDAPILIIHGAEDRTIPLAHGQRLADLAGDNARFEVVEGGGHGLKSHGILDKSIAFFRSVLLHQDGG